MPSYAEGDRTSYVLTMLIAMAAAVASTGGLCMAGTYRDNAWIKAAWRGNDLITLFIAVPLLLLGLLLHRRGSLRGQLVWLAMLAYMLYGYAFYLFGAAFNRFFLLYVAIVAMAIWSLIFALPAVRLERIAPAAFSRFPSLIIAAYMLLTAAGLGGAWVAMCIGFLVTGKVPAPVVASDHPTGIVFALDLTLLVPSFLLAGRWLWKRRPWGYVLGTIVNIKGCTYTLALAAASLFASNAGVEQARKELPLWVALSCVSFAASIWLVMNAKEAR